MVLESHFSAVKNSACRTHDFQWVSTGAMPHRPDKIKCDRFACKSACVQPLFTLELENMAKKHEGDCLLNMNLETGWHVKWLQIHCMNSVETLCERTVFSTLNVIWVFFSRSDTKLKRFSVLKQPYSFQVRQFAAFCAEMQTIKTSLISVTFRF